MDNFLMALHREIDLYAGYSTGTSYSTIFLGGGTPSLLTPEQLGSILTHLHDTFTIHPDAEVTVETNPGTVTQAKLEAYRSLGVNRLSIGIQSFHEDELKFLSRIHDGAQAVRCVELAHGAGFDNLNVDLIYSLPGQTLERWRQNLEKAVSLETNHLSAYSLIVEDHTPLARMVTAKQVSPNPPETEAEMYEYTMEFMAQHGFEHYEVSNYARTGYRSRHNYGYWCHENYLGFGPSAHSFWKKSSARVGRRWSNIASISMYCERLQRHQLPIVFEETLTFKELINERIFLGLRSDGLNMKKMKADFGMDLTVQRSIIQKLVEDNSAVLENDSLRLTPKGYLICDEISERMMM